MGTRGLCCQNTAGARGCGICCMQTQLLVKRITACTVGQRCCKACRAAGRELPERGTDLCCRSLPALRTAHPWGCHDNRALSVLTGTLDECVIAAVAGFEIQEQSKEVEKYRACSGRLGRAFLLPEFGGAASCVWETCLGDSSQVLTWCLYRNSQMCW